MDPHGTNNLARLPGAEGTADPYREPPVNYEAEQALLGAVLANNAAFEKVADFLRPEHFAEPVHGRIFEACGTLIERGQIANAVTLKNVFERAEELAEVGGAQYLSELQGNFVSIINARDYGRTVHDLFLRRQLIAIGEDVVNDAFDHDLEAMAADQIETAEQRLYTLAESGQTEGGLKDFKTAVVESIQMTEAAVKRDSHVAGVATGLTDIDKLLGGLHKSDLVILAGRPSMGKTSLATNIAYNAATSRRAERDAEGNLVELPQVVAFFTLEMSAEQLATRILSEQAHVRSDSMRRGEIRQEEFDRLFEVSRALYDLKLFIDDTPALTIPALRMRARRLKRQQGLGLIVVDYLQLMQAAPGSRNDNRVQEVSEITRGLKAIAKELDVPMLALSQLSRQTEQRDDKRPQLADLRESGSIEQDADVVMFLYREEYYLGREKPSQRANESDDAFARRVATYDKRKDEARNIAEAIVAKQRHGPIGTVQLHFTGEFTQFSDLADHDRMPEQHG
ncbi:MAG: replicative DNA helicase [Rhodospirillales bacterium]|nr:replicative DNA helicase [Rhodospirillales bacterium]MDH3968756.1 replicative DNA helicase [Rhodospirillales bacterium]